MCVCVCVCVCYVVITQDMPEELTAMMYYPEKEQLVVVGVSCSLYLLARNEQENTWGVVSKMKFATGTGEQAGWLHVSVATHTHTHTHTRGASQARRHRHAGNSA